MRKKKDIERRYKEGSHLTEGAAVMLMRVAVSLAVKEGNQLLNESKDIGALNALIPGCAMDVPTRMIMMMSSNTSFSCFFQVHRGPVPVPEL